MEIKALIFDLDGVIVDTARLHYKAWKALADDMKLNFNETINERLKGVSRMIAFDIILEVNGISDKYSDEEKLELATRKNEIYKDLIATLTPDDILPGILDFINDAKKEGVKIAVASASKNAPAVLKAIGLGDTFDYVADAAAIKNPKPAPDVFLDCANALGIDTANCVGVEDAQAGIEAIKNAGMFAVGINVTVTGIAPDLALYSTKELNFSRLKAM